MKKLVLLFLMFSLNSFGSESMRTCMLLPITDSIDNKAGFKVFEDIEEYIKESSWCTYRSNSQLIDVLGQYSRNLESHLNNKDVLKVIADKTKSGSLIKINLNLVAGFTDVSMEILGDNGEDKYFKEATQLKSNDTALISQTIKNWLEVYEKTIPYSGRIKGILGEQFTIDIGRKSNVYNGSEIIIERPASKRQHPLLKEIVDYQTEKIAEAKVFDVNDTQAQAKLIYVENGKRLKLEDWVKVKAQESRKAIEQVNYSDRESEEFGKLGTIGIMASIGSGTLSQSGATSRELSGILYGVDIETELWLTRAYWVGVDYGIRFGSYKKDTGTFTSDSASTNNNLFRLKFGYKYLPMGFFYGPQVDAYMGFGSFTYGVETITNDQITEKTFSGLLIGTKGSLPIYEQLRIFMLFDFLLSSSYKEKVNVFGSDESSSHYRLEFGAQYIYAPNISFNGGINITSNKANFTGSTKEEQFRDVSAKLGTIFTF